jgi:hypothetical protein
LHIGAAPGSVSMDAVETASIADDTIYYEGDDLDDADELDGQETPEEPAIAEQNMRIYFPVIAR